MGSISNNILKYMDCIGIFRLLRWRSADTPRIVMYHGVIDNKSNLKCWWQIKESDFKEQIHYIKKNFNVISIDELNELIIKKKQSSKNTCVLTFDDGYNSFMTKVLPILEYYKLPSTVYISPGVAQKQKMIWTDELFSGIYQSSKSNLDLSDIELGKWDIESKNRKSLAAHSIVSLLKNMPIKKKNNLINEIYCKLDFSVEQTKYQNDQPFKLLLREEIEKISKSPLVTIGSHSMNHEILPRLSKVQIERELNESKTILEDWINKPIKHFSYPDGKFNSEIASMVEKCGYQTATRIGLGRFNADKPFELSRLGTGAWDELADFKAMINGAITMKVETKEYLKKLLKINSADKSCAN